jgi:WD40 repeat protein
MYRQAWSAGIVLFLGWLALVERTPEIQAQQRREFVGHLGAVRDVVISNDQKFVASGAIDASVKFWSIDGKWLESYKHKGQVMAVAISPDGKQFASGAEDRIARLASGKKELGTAKFEGTVNALAFSPDGSRLAVGSVVKTPDGKGAGVIKLFDTAALKEEQELPGGVGSVISLSFSPNGSRLAAGTRDGVVRIWDVAAGKALAELPGHHPENNHVRYSPAGRLYAIRQDKFLLVKVYDGESGRELASLATLAKWCHGLAFSADGKRLVGAFPERLVHWDTATFKEVDSTKLTSPRTLAFTPQGDLLVITGGTPSENHKLAVQTVPVKK